MKQSRPTTSEVPKVPHPRSLLKQHFVFPKINEANINRILILALFFFVGMKTCTGIAFFSPAEWNNEVFVKDLTAFIGVFSI